MDFLERIKDLNDEELEKVVKEKITKLESEKPEDEQKEIGFLLNSNPKRYDMYDIDGMNCFDLDVHCFHAGYIKKGTKIIYGISYDGNANAKSEGNYYYMDDEEYIYEFCKYIRDKDIQNEYELFDYVIEFLRGYFGVIEDISRADMFRLIYKDEETFFKPTKEHSIKDFKGKGNALCTEYSAAAQNILSLFDIYPYFIIGSECIDNGKVGYHAFNIISFNEKSSGEEINALIDFSAPVNLYDIDYNVLSVSPYMFILDDFGEEFVHDFIYNNRDIVAEDYGYIKVGDRIFYAAYDRNRHYFVDGMIYCEEKTKK